MRLAAFALLLAMPAGAAPIVDQEALPDGGFFNVDNNASAFQPFTVGTTGTLTRIDVFVIDDFATCDQGCALSTYASSNFNLPNVASSVLSVLPRIENEWLTFELSSPLPVVSGEIFYFDVDHSNFMTFGSSAYQPGASFECGIGACADPLGGSDDIITPVPLAISAYAFRVWVEPQAVPEPGIATLGAIGLSLCMSRRARHGVSSSSAPMSHAAP